MSRFRPSLQGMCDRYSIRLFNQIVADFVGDTEQSDDLTMLAIQWRKP